MAAMAPQGSEEGRSEGMGSSGEGRRNGAADSLRARLASADAGTARAAISAAVRDLAQRRTMDRRTAHAPDEDAQPRYRELGTVAAESVIPRPAKRPLKGDPILKQMIEDARQRLFGNAADQGRETA